jgi:hypothetical protein
MNHLAAIARPTLSTRSVLATRTAWFAAVAVALVLARHVQAAPPDEWPVIGQQGLVRFVVVPPGKATDQASYEEQIVRLCEPERTCFLNFCTNSTQAAPSVPPARGHRERGNRHVSPLHEEWSPVLCVELSPQGSGPRMLLANGDG